MRRRRSVRSHGSVLLASLLALSIWPVSSLGALAQEHPRLLFVQDEVDFLKTQLGDPLLKEAWAITRGRADQPVGPDIARDYTFLDGRELYGGVLNVDSNDILCFSFAYALTGDHTYAARARSWFANIVDHLDVGYRSGLEWYDAIVWDLMGVRLAVSLDLVWNTMDRAEQDRAASWLDTLAQSVNQLHVKDTNGSYYKKNLASGNIKSWDNALFGCVGYLTGDRHWIEYAFEDPANSIVKEGVAIEMHYRSKIRNGIVEVTTGANSEFGKFRTVDWYRAIEDDQPYDESIGYAQYHMKANEFLRRPALRNGLDLYRLAGRSVGTDERHHQLQPLARCGRFSSLNVPAKNNQWRTWDGSQWIYSREDRHYSGRSSLDQASFCDEVGSPELDVLRTRILELVNGGLIRSSEWYADFHVLRYTWPFLMVNQLKGGVRPVGDLDGWVTFESGPTADTDLDLFHRHPHLATTVRTPVEVDADGHYDALALDTGSHILVARSPGFQTSANFADVVAGQSTKVDLHLEDGEHEVLPRSAVFVDRQDLRELELRHVDPDGIDPRGSLFVFLEQRNGAYTDLLRTAQALFTVEENTSTRLVLKLDTDRLLTLLGDPPDLALWWVVVEPGAALRAADARYRIAD